MAGGTVMGASRVTRTVWLRQHPLLRPNIRTRIVPVKGLRRFKIPIQTHIHPVTLRHPPPVPCTPSSQPLVLLPPTPPLRPHHILRSEARLRGRNRRSVLRRGRNMVGRGGRGVSRLEGRGVRSGRVRLLGRGWRHMGLRRVGSLRRHLCRRCRSSMVRGRIR